MKKIDEARVPQESADMTQTILIVEYDQRWPAIYHREKRKILTALGDTVQAIEHIGSTSIVGLAAKPVLDIMAAIRSFALTETIIEPLHRIGYTYVPEYEVKLPNRRFFHRGPSETTGAINRHFHLHVAEENSDFWTTHILFRNYLRGHPEVAQAYAELKKQLALTCRGNVVEYCNGKKDFIDGVVLLAGKESHPKSGCPTLRRSRRVESHRP